MFGYTHGLGLNIGSAYRRTGGAPPLPTLIYSVDFTAVAKGNAGAMSTITSDMSYTCASGSRYVETTDGVVVANVGTDEVPIGLYGLSLWGATTNGVAFPLTQSGAGWNAAAGGVTTTTGRTDPAGGTNAMREQAASGLYGTYQSVSAAGSITGSWYLKTESSSANRFSWRGLADSGSLTSSYTRRILKNSAAAFIITEGRASSGFGAASAFDVTHAFPMGETTNYATDFHAGARLGARLYQAAAKLPADGRLRMVLRVAPGCSIGGANDSAADLTLAAAGSGYAVTVNKTTGVVTSTVGGSGLTTSSGLTVSRATASTGWIEYRIAIGGGSATIIKAQRQSDGSPTVLGTLASQAAWDSVNATDVLCSGTGGQYHGWVQKVELYRTDDALFTGAWA